MIIGVIGAALVTLSVRLTYTRLKKRQHFRKRDLRVRSRSEINLPDMEDEDPTQQGTIN